jgi:hypothetical protein
MVAKGRKGVAMATGIGRPFTQDYSFPSGHSQSLAGTKMVDLPQEIAKTCC